MPHEQLSTLWVVHVIVYDFFDTGESINLIDYSGCVYLAVDIVHVQKKRHGENCILNTIHYFILESLSIA